MIYRVVLVNSGLSDEEIAAGVLEALRKEGLAASLKRLVVTTVTVPVSVAAGSSPPAAVPCSRHSRKCRSGLR